MDDRKCHTVNLFLVYSPLHYLAAEAVVRYFETEKSNWLFFLKPEYEKIVRKERWAGVKPLLWPRFFPEKGLFGRIRKTRSNLETLAMACKGATEIRLHTPVIDTEAVNYAINFLRRVYPQAQFSVRLLPDGVLNVQRHPLGPFKEMLQYLKKLRRIIVPQLDYYTFKGDRTGADDPIVERIYLLPRFSHQYLREKVIMLPELVSAAERDESLSHAALVIAQPLVMYRRLTPESRDEITEGIRELLRASGIETIHYKGHPRDVERELYHPDYVEIDMPVPLEQYLAEHPYRIVIGICSTALLTSRLILGGECRVVAYGMNKMLYKSEEDRQNLLGQFKNIGVEVLDMCRM